MKKMTLLLLMAVIAVASRAQTAAVVPADATIEDDWVCSFVMHSTSGDSSESEQMQVAFSGDDVYFNLPNPITGNSWIKGTIAGGKATFAKGQYIGNYGGAVYMVAQNVDGLCDLSFVYDADAKTFAIDDMQLVLSASATSIDAWAYYTGMTVVKGGQVQGDEWTFTYTMHYMDNSGTEQTESGSEPVSVQIDGTTIVIALPNPLNGSAEITGTFDGATATFPIQSMGTYGSETFYLAGEDASGLCDVVFNYNAQQQAFTLADMYLLLNSSATQKSAWCYFSAITISKGAAQPAVEETLVELPGGLTPQDYVYTCKSIIYDQEGAIDHMEDRAVPVKVAFDGQTAVYIRGLSDELPLSWVKGTIATGSWDEKIVTFPAGQFLGSYHGYKVYLMGKYMQQFGDAYLELDGQELKNRGFIYINTSKTQEAPLDVYANNNIKLLAVKAATPATPTIVDYNDYNAEEGYGSILLTIPTTDTDGNIIAPGRLGFRLITEKDGQQQTYTFTREKYEDLPQQAMTIIPYELHTGYNFLYGGSCVFICDQLEQNDRLGVQSVYTVGGTDYESAIAWHSFSGTDAVQSVSGTATRMESVTYTDLQGRRAAPTSRGLLIRTQRMADGTVRTTKIVR